MILVSIVAYAITTQLQMGIKGGTQIFLVNTFFARIDFPGCPWMFLRPNKNKRKFSAYYLSPRLFVRVMQASKTLSCYDISSVVFYPNNTPSINNCIACWWNTYLKRPENGQSNKVTLVCREYCHILESSQIFTVSALCYVINNRAISDAIYSAHCKQLISFIAF